MQIVREFDDFVGTCLVRNLCALVEGSDCGVFVVPVSFEGIEEGVDMWIPENGLKLLPRYRVKLNVVDGTGVAVFALFDGLVQELASQACDVLSSMDGASTLYPDDFDLKVGDVVLFKVERDQHLVGSGCPCFCVLELNRDPGVVDLFFRRFFPCLLPKPSFAEVDNINALADVSVESDKKVIESGKEVGQPNVVRGEVVGCGVFVESAGRIGSAKRKLSEFIVDLVGSNDLKKPKMFGSCSP